jgi:hypothetical protein
MSYTHTERVRFGDLDAMRHLNDPSNPERDEFGIIFAECHINYRSPGRDRHGGRGGAGLGDVPRDVSNAVR